ncbi:Mpped2 [Symbiodinium natans]|uniref:Mpped2 protein n=1 Tax=Symbiodinium natans TaxID=878477 RepID=A0A812LZN3_9DINO|nr:Mpped2 [Symbiodinium natans]
MSIVKQREAATGRTSGSLTSKCSLAACPDPSTVRSFCGNCVPTGDPWLGSALGAVESPRALCTWNALRPRKFPCLAHPRHGPQTGKELRQGHSSSRLPWTHTVESGHRQAGVAVCISEAASALDRVHFAAQHQGGLLRGPQVTSLLWLPSPVTAGRLAVLGECDGSLVICELQLCASFVEAPGLASAFHFPGSSQAATAVPPSGPGELTVWSEAGWFSFFGGQLRASIEESGAMDAISSTCYGPLAALPRFF